MQIIHLSIREIKRDIAAKSIHLSESDASILLRADSISSVPDEVKYRLLKELFLCPALLQSAYEEGFTDYLCSDDFTCPHCHSKLYRCGTTTKFFKDQYGENLKLRIHKVRCSRDGCSYVREVKPYFSMPGFRRDTEEIDQVLKSITGDNCAPVPKDPEDRKFIKRAVCLCMALLLPLTESERNNIPTHMGLLDTMRRIIDLKNAKYAMKMGNVLCEFTFSAPS